MGRARRKYREKAVHVADDSEQKKIQVELGQDDAATYDDANALVLPSKKRSTKKLKPKNAEPVKLLSKKRRKHLEKIVDQKKKKLKRASLLEALDEVKADAKVLSHMTQLQATQTLGRKKFLSTDFVLITKQEVDEEGGRITSVIKGRKRKKGELENGTKDKKHKHDPNIVDLGESSSSDDDDDDEEEEENIKVEVIETSEETESNKVRTESEVVEVKVETDLPQDQDSKKPVMNGIEEVKKTAKPGPIKPAVYVIPNRPEKVQAERLKLPILAEEQSIMETIRENPVTVVVGATGSGKTRQVPQFLYEAGYTSNGKMIGITEPRRVAAISMSKRVGHELNLSSREVSYQIRFEGNVTPDTKLKFMTDGVLLKEIQVDPLLKKYSVIIIDEAHERSVFSDILIGILSRILPRREAKKNPLKLIIMSATLRVEDFTQNERLFKKKVLPVCKVDARMFDVTIHYNKRTVEDYMGETYKKACKVHRQLPDGAILIFVTGQQEVHTLIRKLRATFPTNRGEDQVTQSAWERNKQGLRSRKDKHKQNPTQKMVFPKVKLEDFVSALPDDADGEMDEMDTMEDRGVADGGDSDLDLDDDELDGEEGKRSAPEQPMWVLPLYSMLSPDKQQLVFQPPPEGTRLCVIATNVAETSLTIPNIKYVIDCGKFKEKVYDQVTGVSMYHVTWSSQASANQRAGRAGRTAPGHCYRLYSSAVFNDEFSQFSKPEVQRRPVDDLVLIMKSMKLPVVNFPFPTPPDHVQLRHSIKRLIILGGLDETEELSAEAKAAVPRIKREKKKPMKDLSFITPLGQAMAAFPLAPRYGKMLALSHQHNLLRYTVAIVAVLTIQEVLIETPFNVQENVSETRKRWQNVRLSWAGIGNCRNLGDVMVLLRAVGAADYEGGSLDWCEKNGLRHKAINEIRKLRRQLTNEINLIIPKCNLLMDRDMKPPTNDEARLLRQIVLAGTVDHVAQRVDDWELKTPEDRVKWKHAYRTQEMEEPVFLPTSSVLRMDMPRWVVYQEVYETNKMFMRNVTVIEPEWLAVFAPKLCTFSAPLETPEPRYDKDMDRIVCHRKATFGPADWQIPEVEVEYPHCRDLFRWVAYFFLIGEMCPVLKQFADQLLDPRTIINPVAIRYREQREKILRMLMSQNVTSYGRLCEVWKQNPQFLLKEYLLWLQFKEDMTAAVSSMWPPISATINEWD